MPLATSVWRPPPSPKISDAEFNSMPLERHVWHGDWNYDIANADT